MEYPLWFNEYASLPSRIITGLCGDTYALLEDYYLQGGYRVCATREERNAISYDKRKVGMMVYVVSGTTSGGTYFSGNTFWLLINEPVPDPVPPYEYDPTIETPTEDSDWTQLCLFCTTPPPPGPYWTVTPSSREIPTDGSYTSDFTVNFYNWVLPTRWWITEPSGTPFTLNDGSPYYLNLYSGSTDGSTFKASGTTMTYDKTYRDATIVVWATGGTSKTVQIYQNPLSYNPPYFTDLHFNDPHTYEIGATVEDKTFYWTNNFSENVDSSYASDFQIDIGDGLPSAHTGLPKSSPNMTQMSHYPISFSSLTRTTPGTKGPWVIRGKDILSSYFTFSSETISWDYKTYYGRSSNSALTYAQIVALSWKWGSLAGDYDMSSTPSEATYAFWACSTYYPEATYFKNNNTGANFSMYAGYTNKRNPGTNYAFSFYEVTVNGLYRVYRSRTLQTGSISVKITC